MLPIGSAFRYFFDHDGFFLAAGLSFYVVICIVPFLLLVIAGSAFLVSNEMVLREVVDRLGTILPVYQAEMEAALRAVIAARGVSSLVGTLILLFFASQLFAATRLVLNRVFQHKGRGLIHGMLFDLGMILSLTVGFLVSIGITGAFAWVRGLALLLGRGSFVPMAVHWAGMLLTLLLDTALFVGIYRFVPNRRIRWGSVLVGGLATAVLWEVAKQAFRWYIQGFGVYSAVYGSLGVTIALMMWVYYSATVFILGAALIRGLEEHRSRV
ncbi:MAG TPA: YihY/virulence factor BrkB family protein [Methylomirabilota bacterium]|nr:YihY/virulence factor BrkB family protein [Methylomirabilota bacterium]